MLVDPILRPENPMFTTGLIEDHEYRQKVSPEELDGLLATGWRHFGTLFFRYNAAVMEKKLQFILPLRIELAEWKATRSQKRVVKKNADLRTEIRTATIDREKQAMFFRHSLRFTENKPTSLEDFLHPEPAEIPCRCEEVAVFLGEKLVAVSFLAIGKDSVSSIYGIFEPKYASRSLGVYTMLEEIKYAQELGVKYYYSGYSTLGPSRYDYKKGFEAVYAYDWGGQWHPLSHLQKGKITGNPGQKMRCRSGVDELPVSPSKKGEKEPVNTRPP